MLLHASAVGPLQFYPPDPPFAARLKTFQEQLEVEENQVHTHMELLQQRQDRLTRDLNMSLPPTATSAGGPCPGFSLVGGGGGR